MPPPATDGAGDTKVGRIPVTVEEHGVAKRVETVGECWRIDDEWWRDPIARRYVEVILEGGRHVMLYEDLFTGEWFLQSI